MANRFKETGFGKRTLENSDHWIPLNIEEFRIYKPTIICLGGNGTIDSGKAKRFCASAERMVGFKQKEQGSYRNYTYVNVVGFYYGMDKEFKEDGTPFDVGELSSEDCDKIVDNLFFPLCVEHDGSKIPMKRVCKNFSNVIIYCHCYGAKAIGMIMSKLTYKLQKYGYTNDELRHIYSHGFQLSYSPFTDELWFPNVRVDSFTDSLNRGLATIYRNTYGQSLDGIDIRLDKAGKFRSKNLFCSHQDRITVYVSRLVNTTENVDESQIIDEHTFECLERNEDWSIANGAKCADAVSRIFARAFEIAFEYAAANTYVKPINLIARPPMEIIEERLKHILNMFNKEDLKAKKPSTMDTATNNITNTETKNEL